MTFFDYGNRTGDPVGAMFCWACEDFFFWLSHSFVFCLSGGREFFCWARGVSNIIFLCRIGLAQFVLELGFRGNLFGFRSFCGRVGGRGKNKCWASRAVKFLCNSELCFQVLLLGFRSFFV